MNSSICLLKKFKNKKKGKYPKAAEDSCHQSLPPWGREGGGGGHCRGEREEIDQILFLVTVKFCG